jgi:hypothetical protein
MSAFEPSQTFGPGQPTIRFAAISHLTENDPGKHSVLDRLAKKITRFIILRKPRI